MGEAIIEEWTVLGMSCGGCSASIERALEGVAGLRAVRADAAADRVTLEFDGDTVDRSLIQARIEAAGFDIGDHA